jgi:hypothetical protein
MARLANTIFQHERDIDYFLTHHRVKLGSEREAEAADKLLAADVDCRLAQLRANYDLPGRIFYLATHLTAPADFLLSSKSRKEEILGWAEWQDPLWPPAPTTAISPFAPVVKDLTFRYGSAGMLAPPNGLALNLGDALESFRRARTDNPQEWDRWRQEIIPTCFGEQGDVQGRHLSKHHPTLPFHQPLITHMNPLQSSAPSSSKQPTGTTASATTSLSGACSGLGKTPGTS